MNPEEVEVFARGLYYLADVDGIDDRETALIKEFLSEAGSELSLDDGVYQWRVLATDYACNTNALDETIVLAAVDGTDPECFSFTNDAVIRYETTGASGVAPPWPDAWPPVVRNPGVPTRQSFSRNLTVLIS